jgi:hypothetical protein
MEPLGEGESTRAFPWRELIEQSGSALQAVQGAPRDTEQEVSQQNVELVRRLYAELTRRVPLTNSNSA